MTITCRACEERGPHHAHGLCRRCYRRQWHAENRAGNRECRPWADVVEDAEWLASLGYGWREAARRIGYKESRKPADSGLYQALRRSGRLDVWMRLKEAY